jgi:hypothetical protein
MINGRRDEIAKLREASVQMGIAKLRNGTWFQSAIMAYVQKSAEASAPAQWEALFPGLDADARARSLILRAARRAAVAGAAAASATSAGEMLSLLTEGLGAPVGVPATVASMTLEAAYTALLQIDLACDLASSYGVPFDPHDVGEVATLFAVALELDMSREEKTKHGAGDDAPRGITAALIDLHDSDVAAHIGRKLLHESLLRNVVPIVGVAISARWNYVATVKLAATVRRYVRYRAALRRTVTMLPLAQSPDAEFLIGGAWLIATADGAVAHEETLAMAAIVDAIGCETEQLDAALATENEGWFERLERMPPERVAILLDVLSLIAATDKRVHESESRFLARVGATLAREIDFDRIRRLCEYLDHGEQPPREIFLSTQ